MLEYYLSLSFATASCLSPPSFPRPFPSAPLGDPDSAAHRMFLGNNVAGKIQSGVSARDGRARLIELVVRDFPAGCRRLRRCIIFDAIRWGGSDGGVVWNEKEKKKCEAMSIDEWSQFRGKLLIEGGAGRIYSRLDDFETLICRRRSFSRLSADRSPSVFKCVSLFAVGAEVRDSVNGKFRFYTFPERDQVRALYSRSLSIGCRF